ncbi:hypothetical protein [Mesobacillus selenatarsenatis]|uniref:Uncharacterized protein n=1 Tax=Mesobacillus selenatarsenatis (strain DSM 18680 / JCM 14380 / FERM P-15431 / SF-1) TaxID=1321606 RepID=A0A0A8X1G7_MESS1|nr:hypothetical protein [Mesobacillus selenatarsenatis]GAM11956.1 hypothetical protein SAMD00020551_0074 [Mesobacillus selenatarsenatis SF-1]
MLLPASDLGLITSHLPAHDGMIMKVKLFAKEAKDEKLLELLNRKVGIMRCHVRIMMDMLDSDKSEFEKLPDFDELPQSQLETTTRGTQKMDKHIAMEIKASTEAMAKDNFVSALKMKDPKVKQIHIEMALQQVQLLKMVTEYLQENEADVTPLGTAEEQKKVVNHFSHMMEE